jgi:DNA (cytosine-5)-methyltransferase 1
LSQTACRGILRRAKKRDKELPAILKTALELQASIPPEILALWKASADRDVQSQPVAFACNQRDEVRDLNDVAGAVQARCDKKRLLPQDISAAKLLSQL